MYNSLKKIVDQLYQQQQQNKEIQISLENACNLLAKAQNLIQSYERLFYLEQKTNSKVFTYQDVTQLTSQYSKFIEYYSCKNNSELCEIFMNKIHDLLNRRRVNSVLDGNKSSDDEEKKIFYQNIKQSVQYGKLEEIARKESEAIIKKYQLTKKRVQFQTKNQNQRLNDRIRQRTNSRSKKNMANDSKNKRVISPNKSNQLNQTNNLTNTQTKRPIIPKPLIK